MKGGPRGGPPGGTGGRGRGGPVGKQEGIDGERWGKRALPPPPKQAPSGTRCRAIANLPALHKTDNKFKVRFHAKLPSLPAELPQNL